MFHFDVDLVVGHREVTNLDFAEVQRERDEVLTCGQKEIQALAGYLDAIMAQDVVCVVGNGQSIDENKEMFMKVENLFH